MLADFGAEVIKVQSAKMATGIESNTAPYFCAWNRNKRSITLDMDHHEAREIFLKLVSGTGQKGPWKDFVAYGPTLQSLAGLTYLTSYSQEAPMGFGYAYADMVSGLYGAISILAALEHRDRCGQGQYIDLSEYETGFNHHPIVPKGNDAANRPAAPYGCYKCSGEDRWCVIAVFTEDEWQSLCGLLGNPAWSKADQFSSLAGRIKHKKILDRHMGKWTAGQTAEKVVEDLQQAGIAAGVVQNAEDLANDPQLSANKFFTSLNHPVLGQIKTDTYPIKFKNGRPAAWKASPTLGEANQYVLEKLLGMKKAAIQSYIDQGIIA
jgi:crotonobetainyl-CoA:carnitine CoA-transferase CaiB-like acyl-CoA transferase